MNMCWLGERELSLQTRNFLTNKRLIERQDKTRSVESEGNGLVLSAKGLALLVSLPPFKGVKARMAPQVTDEPPTDRQLAFAHDLGISIPAQATKLDLTDLIDAQVHRDKPAAPALQVFAKRFGVIFSQYAGKKSLFDRLFTFLTRPGREEDMTAWFVFRVYRELVRGKAEAAIKDADDQTIREIARLLLQDKGVVQSIRRYQGRDLVWFGEWTSPDGEIHQGASNQTIAYQRASSLLREKVSF